MGTLELPQQSPIVGEDDHVKLVTMRISDQNIPSICQDKVTCYKRNVSSKQAPDMSIPFGKFVIFSHPILLRNCPSSVKTTTL